MRVRQGELWCSRCKAWKEDDAFPRNAHEKYLYRRSRGGTCNECMAALRASPPEKKRVTPKQQMRDKRARLDPGPASDEELGI